MQASTVTSAIEIVELDVAGFPTFPVPAATFLVADGRMLVLLPVSALKASTNYLVRWKDDAEPRDLTGQPLGLAGNLELETFSVAGTDPAAPKVLASWPLDGALSQSDISEITVVFDRQVQSSTVDGDSWVVTTEGQPPTFDPAPTPVTVPGGLFPVPDTRVYRYRSLDANASPASLGLDADVALALSPPSAPILDTAGAALPATSIGFHTASFAVLSAALTSAPDDAIGIKNLSAGDPEELAIEVQLQGGEAGDLLTAFVFGTSPGDDPVLVALQRSIDVQGAGASATFALADLELLETVAPLQAELADGPVSFAFRLGHGASIGSVRNLDVDPAASGIQDPVLDTLAPTIEELLVPGGSAASYLSDGRDLIVAGRASEQVRAADVSSAAGGNGVLAGVLGASAGGLFLARAVDLGNAGIADPAILPLAFDLTVYDQALNASAGVASSFRQRGAVGPGALVPGDPLSIEVFDAFTLAPIAGARVIAHDHDGVANPLLGSDTTDAFGLASVPSSLAAGRTAVTIDAAGYDLFTFDGATSGRLSMPLTPIDEPAASVAGTLTTTSTIAQLTLTLLGRQFGDPRRADLATSTYAGSNCISLPFGGTPLDCPYGPQTIRTGRLGAQSALCGNFALSEAQFSAASLIQAFDIQLPLAPVDDGEDSVTAVEIPFLFSEPTVPLAELPVEAPPATLAAGATTGIDLGNLVSNPAFTGAPRVSIEALVPGVPGAAPVGLGLAFDQGGGVWNVRSAHPGTAAPGGELAAGGAIDADLFLRVELRDTAGNLAAARPRLSQLAGLGSTLAPLSVPQLVSPPPGGSTGPAGYVISVENVVTDATSAGGLCRVRLSDATLRRWDVWTVDPPDASPSVDLLVPDVAAAGGAPLADGTLSVQAAAFAWPGFDAAAFMWTDVERDRTLYAQGAAVTLTQP
jgi:hypothetical protein